MLQIKTPPKNIDNFDPKNNTDFRIILQEFSVIGEESLFESHSVWDYSVTVHSESAVVYLIPFLLFKSIPLPGLEKIKKLFEQKKNFRINLNKKKTEIAKKSIPVFPEKIIEQHKKIEGKISGNLIKIIGEKSLFRRKGAILKTIQNCRKDKIVSLNLKDHHFQLVNFGKNQNSPKNSDFINHLEKENFAVKKKVNSVNKLVALRTDFSRKLIGESNDMRNMSTDFGDSVF